MPLANNMAVDDIQKHYSSDGFQKALLPLPGNCQNRQNPAGCTVRDGNIVNVLDMCFNFSVLTWFR